MTDTRTAHHNATWLDAYGRDIRRDIGAAGSMYGFAYVYAPACDEYHMTSLKATTRIPSRGRVRMRYPMRMRHLAYVRRTLRTRTVDPSAIAHARTLDEVRAVC